MAGSSDFAKNAKKCIFLVDPLWCTVHASFLCISRRQNLNYPFFFCKLYPHNLNSQDFLHTIIITSRRKSIKTTKKILENYEYTGHSLDTITAWFFQLLVCHFLCFYYALCAFWAQQIIKIKQIWTEFRRYNYELITKIILSILYTFCRVQVIKKSPVRVFPFYQRLSNGNISLMMTVSVMMAMSVVIFCSTAGIFSYLLSHFLYQILAMHW